jgi:hypothetical protein
MFLLLQLAIAVAFLGYLVLAFFDLIHGLYHISIGLCLLAYGLSLTGIAFILKKFNPAPVPVAATPRVRTWKVAP